jgi:hypothetical protein
LFRSKSLTRKSIVAWFENNCMFFFLSHLDKVLTLSYPSTKFAPWKASSIANPTHVDILLWAISTHHFSISKANQKKKKSCWEWHPRYKFIPLTNEILCCFHKRREQCLTSFFQQCFLIAFLKQEISKTLQNMEVFRILSWTTIVVLATSQFPSLSDPSPLTT